ncbi:hypothetical protein BGZ70_002645 [Mortierella alpina]|uniref:FAD-binding domain-containing protein n=1 Tax=Mortierella alpina TaxID=64518 RepID=A0A9P6LWH8_MORAP|nr:hypothetical protein BGZ70_002645 [Mortierella alpina]
MSVARHQVLGAYRNLLKAQRQTFKAARLKTYTEFDTKRNEMDEIKIKEQLELANQVASLLRHNLAQAVQVEGKDDIYSLKLNQDHELGDNETLRQASKLRRLRNQEAGAIVMVEQTHAKKPKVLIAGAGLGGITLAILLEKAGVPYEIFERATEVKHLGSVLSINSNVLYMFRQIGVYEEFVARSAPYTTVNMYNENREKEFIMDFGSMMEMGGIDARMISRPDLYELLLKQVPTEKIHMGKRVLSIEQGKNGVMIRCADTSIYEGDILVGADGAYSGVRQSLYQQLKKRGDLPSSDDGALPFSCVCLVGRTGPMDPTKFTELSEPTCHFNSVLATDRPYSYLDKESTKASDGFRNSEWGPEAAEAMCKDVHAFPIPGGVNGDLTMGVLIDNTPKHLISKVMLEEKVFDTWFADRTVLMGDACHKVHPAAGGGALNAMQDAIVLANWINTLTSNSYDDIQNVFQEYKAERFPFAKEAFASAQIMAKITARKDQGSVEVIDQPSLRKTLEILKSRSEIGMPAEITSL